MTITSSGAKCDVCGNFILPLDPDERVHSFSCKGMTPDPMHCCNECRAILESARGDWTKLPDGPMRKAFQAAFDAQQKAVPDVD